jgi:electron transport complex protein RnfC
MNARKLFDFHGGIHPPEHKSESNLTPIVKAPIPPVLYLPLQQHIGKEAELVVSVGERVLKGQLLATPQGAISAAVHAPTSGSIEAIIDHPMPHPSGMSDRCIVLIPDGRDEWCALQPCEHYEKLSPDEIRQRVRAAGIAGMGGAGFPTEVKLHPPQQDKVATLILNAAECEPYITSDDRLMRERADEIVQGMAIMAYVLEPGECLIGIEDNKPEAIAALKQAVTGTRIEVVVVPTKYPSGGEKQLIKLLTGKEVPSGRIPADIGVMCQNVATAAAVYRAVRFGEPLIARITTLTGENMQQRGNVEALIGTPIGWLLEQFGGRLNQAQRVIMGGPMMGFTLLDLDAPVVKTTNCLLLPSDQELPLAGPAQACIRCSLCADACPAELLPQQLYWFARAEELDKAEHHNLFDCIECGACAYVCPSSIPLVQYYRHAKGEIRKVKLEHQRSDQARERFEARLARLEREQAEKEAKRKERAEAAAQAQAAKLAADAEAAKHPAPPVTPAPVAPTEADAPDLDKLKQDWDNAQNKLNTMLEVLEDAKINQPDNVEKFTRAVEKNQMRVNQARIAYESAQKALNEQALKEPASASTGDAASLSLDELQKNLDKAQEKLTQLEQMLADAAGTEQAEKLTRAVEKNRVRVEAARAALLQAQGAQA